MATSSGTIDIAGSVTVEVNGNTWTRPIHFPIAMDAHYDKASGTAKLKIDAAEFTKRSELIKEWLGAMPEELCHG